MKLAEYVWSPRTLSFWLATAGIIGIVKGKRWAGHFLLAVGWGGAGGAYFRVAHREGVPVEPTLVVRYCERDDWRAIVSHAVLIAPGVWALRRK